MNEKGATQSAMRFKQQWLIVTALIGALGFSSLASGQTPPWLDSDESPVRARQALTEYLSDKYPNSSVDVRTIRDGRNVAWQWLSLFGQFTPKEPIVPEPGKHGQARARARAFLEEEAVSLFGIAPAHIRIKKVWENMPGYVTKKSIRHEIYVGDLPLEGAWVNFGFDHTNQIINVSAHVVPINAAMRQAAKRPTIDEQQIRRLVQADIEADAKSPDVPYPVKRYVTDPRRRSTDIAKIAIPSPPYVVWHVQSIWRYYIDAFTGEILSKMPGWAEAR